LAALLLPWGLARLLEQGARLVRALQLQLTRAPPLGLPERRLRLALQEPV